MLILQQAQERPNMDVGVKLAKQVLDGKEGVVHVSGFTRAEYICLCGRNKDWRDTGPIWFTVCPRWNNRHHASCCQQGCFVIAALPLPCDCFLKAISHSPPVLLVPVAAFAVRQCVSLRYYAADSSFTHPTFRRYHENSTAM
ncbi:uncharacterized [Tachysurus ichikawai]